MTKYTMGFFVAGILCGMVLTRAEAQAIAGLAIAHDLLVVTDEVYEHLVFDGEHVPIATLPGMRDRTVSISSGGKTFSFTGWKVGWLCASPPLLSAVRTVKQFLTYVNGAPFQPAVAAALLIPFLPLAANSFGWIFTEVGRQPWIVQGLLLVKDAVSPLLTTLDLWISLIGYTLVYGTLAVAMFYLMKKYAVAGPDAALQESVDVVPALVGSDD